MSQLVFGARVVSVFFQRLSLLLFAGLALGLLSATVLAALQIWPWIEVPLRWDGTEVAHAGVYAQIALTIIAVGLCFFLPSNWRILQLETSHRRFELSVDDITRAYHAAHAADREGVFGLADAFENTRERLAYLREHPDLGHLEPEILELAAKMSFISRDLAQAYSQDKVQRARAVLQERQHEIEQFNDRLVEAKAIHGEFSTWIKRLELEEDVARAHLAQLLDEMERLLPEMADPKPRPAKVTLLPKTRAE